MHSEDSPRARLLTAVVEHVVARGISDLSLREVAAAVGTSHRMLIYHFGSKVGLLVAVVRAVEEAQRAFLAELAADPALSPADTMRRLWRRLADPDLAPAERLFFELYGQALQGRPGTAGFLDDIVTAWAESFTEYNLQRGHPLEIARADARLGVAVMRGLLLDLLATGDRAAVELAVERYISQYEAVNKSASVAGPAERPHSGDTQSQAESESAPRPAF